MTQNSYPIISDSKDVLKFIREITRLRQEEDIPNFLNLNKVFVAGRVTERIPSSATDVIAGDNSGDIVTDVANGFEYKLVDNAGTFIWDRRVLDTSW